MNTLVLEKEHLFKSIKHQERYFILILNIPTQNYKISDIETHENPMTMILGVQS